MGRWRRFLIGAWLALWIGVTAMWVRSYFAGDAYPLIVHGTTGQVVPGEYLQVRSWSGRIFILWLRLSPAPARVGAYRLDVGIGSSGLPRNNALRESKILRQEQRKPGGRGVGYRVTLPTAGLRTAYGLWWYTMRFPPTTTWHILSIPYWFPWLLVPLIPLAAWLHRRRHHERVGKLCANCGYDLRASPLRCPECGRDTPPISIEGEGD